ncbi:heavy metal sensor histidine kinase [Chitinimonas sp.]|uniref:heavy metal sensor histidine kinase n=1 Tax=Chitinimonas sp. TaxID=1934313 RepID=UPI002F9464C2
MRWRRASNSLAVRLIVMLTITSALVISAAGFLFYAALEAQLNGTDKEEIQLKMGALEQLLKEMPEEVQPYDLIERLHDITSGHPKLQFGVKARSGWLIVPELKFQHALEQAGDVADRRISTLHHESGAWLVRKSSIAKPGPSGVQAVYLAVNVTDSRLTIRRYRSTAVGITLLTTLLLGTLGFLVVRRALAPLEQLAQEAEQITAEQLHTPLTVTNPHDEVGRLVGSINRMLGRLNQSFNRLEQFAADIAHELRTPINSLLQKTEVSLSRPRSLAEYEDLHHANLAEFGKLKHMVADMLFLARVDHGMLVLSRKEVNLACEARKVAEFFDYPASEKRQTIAVEGEGTAVADGLMVQQALTNLLSNAVKYGLPDTPIHIAIAQQTGQATVAVRNAALPLQDADLQGLFTRFKRGADVQQRDIEGTGLGLAIVRSIMKAHGGTAEASYVDGAITVVLRFAT